MSPVREVKILSDENLQIAAAPIFHDLARCRMSTRVNRWLQTTHDIERFLLRVATIRTGAVH
jgi:hypothetical protein